MERFENKLVIGLTGPKGSGKESFGKLFTELVSPNNVGIEVFSSLLVETADAWGLPITRAALQGIPEGMIHVFGPDVLANAVYNRVLKKDEEIVIIDGARTKSDFELVRRFPKNLFVYITADPEVRWQRTRKRGQKAGEANTPLEQFMQEENALVERQIPEIGSQADFVIDNNGTLEEYQKQIDRFYREMVLPKLQQS